MLIILLLFALIRTLHSVPLSSPLEPLDELSTLVLRDAQTHFGNRAVSDIVTSCIATIFACTWSAVHPNIPGPTDCAWTCFKRQFITMLYALLAPEAITTWALRQHLGAKKIMDEYNTMREANGLAADVGKKDDKSNWILHTMRLIFQDSLPPTSSKKGEMPEWTSTHGFFLQMGGFMLSEGGRPIQTLSSAKSHVYSGRTTRMSSDDDKSESCVPTQTDDYTSVLYCIQTGIIDPPLTTRKDIEDRAKGDAISKILIILQTTWFIVQCIARWFSRLPVSELEVVTLGFAMLNGITCGLWWHKPQNVGRPVFLEIKLPLENSRMKPLHRTGFTATDYSSSTTTLIAESIRESPEKNSINTDRSYPKDSELRKSDSTPTSASTSYPDRELPGESHAEFSDSSSSTATLISDNLCMPRRPRRNAGYLLRKLRHDVENHVYGPWALLWQVPLLAMGALLRPIGKLADVEVTNHLERSTVRCGDLRVPMFFSYYDANDSKIHNITILIGILFGSVHLTLSWALKFSSIQEMLIWRISAIITTIAPIFLICWGNNTIMNVLVVIWLSLYIICRVMLLSLSLISLHTLPPGALQTIDWTTFIPHI